MMQKIFSKTSKDTFKIYVAKIVWGMVIFVEFHSDPSYRVTFKEWPPYSEGKCVFFEVYHTLWDIITPNKPILVKNEL